MSRENNFYEFYDLWQLHPTTYADDLSKIYDAIIEGTLVGQTWPYDPKMTYRYQVRQGHLNLFSQLTIFDGLPSLFQFMDDSEKISDPTVSLIDKETLKEHSFRCKDFRGRSVVKLGRIVEAKTGLQSPENQKYYRIAPGTKGGATKGGYKVVNDGLTLSPEQLHQLASSEKSDGIIINDPDHDKYFVPLDKTGEADIEGKVLSQYFRLVEFYVNWSSGSVYEMKNDPRARFQNSDYYFEKGITFSDTGIYSPTFRLSHGGVFDQKSSCIFCPYYSREFLLGVLNSKLVKYFVKVFINHTVSSTVNSIKAIPFVIPSADEQTSIETLVGEIIARQSNDPSYDFVKEQSFLDEMVYRLYKLTEEEMQEVEDWYARRYPKLRRDIDVAGIEEQ